MEPPPRPGTPPQEPGARLAPADPAPHADPFDRIESILHSIDRQLAEVREELRRLRQAARTEGVDVPAVDESALRRDFDLLYERFLAEGPQILDDFARNRNVEYLRELCRANGVPADGAELSPGRVAFRLVQAMATRRAHSRRRS
jgi:hypothetical protein